MSGGKDGGGSIPYKDEASQMMFGSLANRLLRSDPAMQNAFKQDTKLGESYRDLFGSKVPKYEGFGKVPSYGDITSNAYQQLGLSLPKASSKSTTSSNKGSGAYTKIPTGNPYTDVKLTTPQTQKINALNVPSGQFDIYRNLGTSTIQRGANQAQQELMRTMGSRGLGRSGLAMAEAARQYQRGAGEQQSALGQQLAADRMGLEFGEAQTARGLEAQRDLAQANLSQQTQAQQLQQALNKAQMGISGRAQGLSEALGLGNLGLAERAQGLSELSAQRSYEDAPLQALAGLGQSNIAAAASKGKGGGK